MTASRETYLVRFEHKNHFAVLPLPPMEIEFTIKNKASAALVDATRYLFEIVKDPNQWEYKSITPLQ